MNHVDHFLATLATMTEADRGALYGVAMAEPHAVVFARRFNWDRLCADESTRFVIPVPIGATPQRLAHVINNGRNWLADYDSGPIVGAYGD